MNEKKVNHLMFDATACLARQTAFTILKNIVFVDLSCAFLQKSTAFIIHIARCRPELTTFSMVFETAYNFPSTNYRDEKTYVIFMFSFSLIIIVHLSLPERMTYKMYH